jgi:hypothetical protein
VVIVAQRMDGTAFRFFFPFNLKSGMKIKVKGNKLGQCGELKRKKIV